MIDLARPRSLGSLALIILAGGCGAAVPGTQSPSGGLDSEAGGSAEATSFMRVGDVKNVPQDAPLDGVLSPPPPDGNAEGGGSRGKEKDPHLGLSHNEAETAASSAPIAPGAAPRDKTKNVQGAVVDSEGGLSEAEVRATIVQKQGSFRQCYDLGAAGASSGFAGTVSLRVSIGPSGSVTSVDVVSSTTRNSQVDSCVAEAVRRIQFPAKGGGAVVGFPVEFGK